jgi:hypothetical protein
MDLIYTFTGIAQIKIHQNQKTRKRAFPFRRGRWTASASPSAAKACQMLKRCGTKGKKKGSIKNRTCGNGFKIQTTIVKEIFNKRILKKSGGSFWGAMPPKADIGRY